MSASAACDSGLASSINPQPSYPAIITAIYGSCTRQRICSFDRQLMGIPSAGYWIPAAKVPDGLAVLPLDGVLENVSKSATGGDSGDVGHAASFAD